jgi:hypothetical protein
LRTKLALKRKARGANKFKSFDDDENEYCTPVTMKLSLTDGGLDVGILTSSCLDPTRTCVPDASSSLGGRCTSKEDWLITADHAPSSGPDKSAEDINAKWSTEHIGIAGQECKPAEDLDGQMDVGILRPIISCLYECKNPEHECIAYDSSPHGGVCVDYPILSDELEEVDHKHLVRGHRNLIACDYVNGTSGGTKCTGNLACDGLSAAFIATNIGCGSCNGNYGESDFLEVVKINGCNLL